MASPLAQTRDFMRFKPDPLEFAQIQFGEGDTEDFKPDMVALIADESPKSGCGLVIHPVKGLGKGSYCNVKLGKLSPVPAKVVRAEPIEEYGLEYVGIKFLH